MTFNFAPWAIDGARTAAGLARLASYAGGGGRSGVIRPLDLRVTALATPGPGLRIGAGGAMVLNHYLSNPDESYVVSNPASHTVLAATMPPSQPGTTYYLVCVVVGDPEFDQTGHPFMPSGALDPADAPDFEYVRVVIVPCPAGTTRFETLGYNYPAYALARLEVPANTTTITNAMITDLRDLSKARTSTEMLVGRPSHEFGFGTWLGAAWSTFSDFQPYINVPSWATRMQVLYHVGGLGNSGAAVGEVRGMVAGTSGPAETYDIDGASERTNLMAATDVNVSAYAGGQVQLYLEVRQLFDLPGYAFSDARTQIAYDVRFSEGIL